MKVEGQETPTNTEGLPESQPVAPSAEAAASLAAPAVTEAAPTEPTPATVEFAVQGSTEPQPEAPQRAKKVWLRNPDTGQWGEVDLERALREGKISQLGATPAGTVPPIVTPPTAAAPVSEDDRPLTRKEVLQLMAQAQATQAQETVHNLLTDEKLAPVAASPSLPSPAPTAPAIERPAPKAAPTASPATSSAASPLLRVFSPSEKGANTFSCIVRFLGRIFYIHELDNADRERIEAEQRAAREALKAIVDGESRADPNEAAKRLLGTYDAILVATVRGVRDESEPENATRLLTAEELVSWYATVKRDLAALIVQKSSLAQAETDFLVG